MDTTVANFTLSTEMSKAMDKELLFEKHEMFNDTIEFRFRELSEVRGCALGSEVALSSATTRCVAKRLTLQYGSNYSDRINQSCLDEEILSELLICPRV